MLKVHIKTNPNFKMTLPIPHPLLGLGLRLISSKTLWNFTIKCVGHNKANDWSVYLPKDPAMIKRHLRPVLKELRSLKGHSLVDIQTKDGTIVKITC
ncbi:MAG TPA: hypothetical protein VLK78_00090 [Candidatus Angelobacter sp.]|nr:hypothetical protein [Candidatus Angelobacter sp.]